MIRESTIQEIEVPSCFHHQQGYFAALDLGSNTCRVLIARPTQTGYKVVDSFSRVIRLGTGVRSSGKLSTEAMDRAIEALKECARKLQKYNVLSMRCVATEACRQATNKDDFLQRVYTETGIELEIISDAEEARLALKGCRGLICPSIPYVLAFDIGGCSTEVMWATTTEPKQAPKVLDWMSLPFGVVSVLEACGGDAELFYDDIRKRIYRELSAISKNQDIQRSIVEKQVQMIGSSGTTTTVAAIHQKLNHYDRSKVDGCVIPICEIHRIGKELLAMKPRERADHSCIGPGRSDLVLGGMAILEGICDTWPLEKVCVADRGVRDGILADMLARPLSFTQGEVIKQTSVA